MGATTPEEVLGMSDEDFMKELAPSVEPAAVKTPEEIAAEEQAAATAQAALDAEAQSTAQASADAEAQRVATEQAQAAAETGSDDDKTRQPQTQVGLDGKPVVPEPEKTPEQLATEQAAAATTEAGAKAQAPDDKTSTVDYQKAYEAIMAPFKANGKTMQVQTPEEAIALMQMGANYTRKMQELQPQRKTLLLLENNGLLESDKLSYLIDLSKGDPEAIKKLLKDTKFDVFNADLDKESTYRGGNHTVSDEEVNFRTVLDELNSNPVGKETLQVINSSWDHASKEVLWSNPEVMAAIHSQRESGIYARIVTEMERRKTFGQIQPGTPFLHAYRAVGDDLQKSGHFNDLVPQKPALVAATPVAVKAAMPKPTGVDPKVAAAAVHRSSAVKTDGNVNPLTMSDEDFLKMPIPK